MINDEYFRHDINSLTDDKIQAMLSDYGVEGYGLFWATLETCGKQTEYKLPRKEYIYKAIAQKTKKDDEFIKEYLNKCVNVYELFKADDNYIYSLRFIENMKYKDDAKQKKIEAGTKGAFKRWENKCNQNINGDAITTPLHSDSNAIAKNSKIKTKTKNKSKHNNIMIKPTIKEIQAYIIEKELKYVNAEVFYYHYEGKADIETGVWYIGDEPMQNWKITLNGWNARAKAKINNKTQPRGRSKHDLQNKHKYNYDKLSEKWFNKTDAGSSD